ncbi:MAG: type VI secretion system ATPase TssH, partial [Oceanidesulfovibrio sp.]
EVRTSGEYLRRFTVNLSDKAHEGAVDPVFGREEELRRLIDILARRRKNNPILVGDAGVGKTAVVEGLALRMAEDEALPPAERRLPSMLWNVSLVALDVGLLEAGAGLKGEFEDRLQRVLADIQSSPNPIILFIDEAHTLIGAGGRPGGSDAANLLKPVLARGEVRTIAATTWREYKRYFERDAALSRRFQPVVLDEPSVRTTAQILRGLKSRYEEDHGVFIREDAVDAAAQLAARYITGRFLPDKAVDLLDTAAARVQLSLTGRPDALDRKERDIEDLRREIEGLMRDRQGGLPVDEESLRSAWERLDAMKQDARTLRDRWRREKILVDRLFTLREVVARVMRTPGLLRDIDPEGVRAELAECLAELKRVQGETPLIRHEVDPDTVARVVSQWTGIPLGKVRRDEAASVLGLKFALRERIRGQDTALEILTRAIRASKSGLKEPDAPLGVFLLAGPSGVGKTETARAVSDLLFGEEASLLALSMSEYQESHSISRLIGSPPGYVGFGEGGVLTDALRRRPYSVVLLDEAEKAHPEVLSLFHQIFDTGVVSDAEGRAVDCRHSLFFLTTTVSGPAREEGSSESAENGTPGQADDEILRELLERIRPQLADFFPPGLLARTSVVPFRPLSLEALEEIVSLKLTRLAIQAEEGKSMLLDFSPDVVHAVARLAESSGSGARGVDSVLRMEVLPRLAEAILQRSGADSRDQDAQPDVLRVECMPEDGAVRRFWRFSVRAMPHGSSPSVA